VIEFNSVRAVWCTQTNNYQIGFHTNYEAVIAHGYAYKDPDETKLRELVIKKQKA
jgi:hypothetical protein